MKERLKKMWPAFVNIAVVFSFIVNCVLVLVLILAIGPLFQMKSNLLEPLLTDLDRAFQGLGDTTIDTTVQVEEMIPISFTLPMNQPLGLDFDLPIHQQTNVILTREVQITRQARFELPYGGGAINGTVSLSLPAGLSLPIQLDMQVPVQQVIPVVMDVPVNQPVPIEMDIPVSIQLGDAGLDPAVQQLRDVFAPVSALIERIPDGIQFR